MGKMERMVVLVTLAQKRSIVSRAKSQRLSMGEMVRRSVEAYRAEEDEKLLERLLDRVNLSSAEAAKALGDAEAEVRVTLRHFARQRKESVQT